MPRRRTLWFVIPAWKRFELTKICLLQKVWAIEKLASLGVDAQCVVVADDENLDTASDLGMYSVECPNGYTAPSGKEYRYLGRKFNEGYAYAAAEKVDYVCPIGSDSWVDPTFIAENLPRLRQRAVVYSQHYAVIRPDGKKRVQLLVTYDGGTTMFYPTNALKQCNYRPVPETAPKGCDGYTIDAIKAGGETEFIIAEKHDLETVSFQSELQVTKYDALIDRWGCGETDKPFEGLTDHYPLHLVKMVRDFYAERQEAEAA